MSHNEFSYSVYSSTFTANTGYVFALGSSNWRKLISTFCVVSLTNDTGFQIIDLKISDSSSNPVFRQEMARITSPDTNGMFLSMEQRLAAPSSIEARVLLYGSGSSTLVQTALPDNILIPPGSFITVMASEGSGGQIYNLSIIADDA